MMNIGCILMASGVSVRYGRNKLLEEIDGRAVILHAADSLIGAGLAPLAVTRSAEVKALLDRAGIRCVLHDGPRKCDTMRAGLENLPADLSGYLFMPADQPLALPESLKRLVEAFLEDPSRAVRLGYGDAVGSPVIFPANCRDALMRYTGDRGGMDVLRTNRIPCDTVQSAHPWELWDIDTPEDMARIKAIKNHECEEPVLIRRDRFTDTK